MGARLIERLAREAGFDRWEDACLDGDGSDLDHAAAVAEYPVGVKLACFAALVAEECAKVCDLAADDPSLGDRPAKEGEAEHAANVIRAKFRNPDSD